MCSCPYVRVVYPTQIILSSTVVDAVIMESSKVKTCIMFHKYYQLDITKFWLRVAYDFLNILIWNQPRNKVLMEQFHTLKSFLSLLPTGPISIPRFLDYLMDE